MIGSWTSINEILLDRFYEIENSPKTSIMAIRASFAILDSDGSVVATPSNSRLKTSNARLNLINHSTDRFNFSMDSYDNYSKSASIHCHFLPLLGALSYSKPAAHSLPFSSSSFLVTQLTLIFSHNSPHSASILASNGLILFAKNVLKSYKLLGNGWS
jgi:hypothetical protein